MNKMDDKTNNKRKITFIILMTFICLILIVGITYAFVKFVIGGSSNNFIGINSVTVDYIDGQTIKIQNLQLPIKENEIDNYSVKHTFSAYNSGDNNAYITVKLTDVILDNEIANDENLRYTLYSGSNKISTGSFNETNNGTLILGRDIPVTAGSTEEFGISIWIRDNGGNQNHFLNKSISGKINIEGTDKQLTYKDSSGANEPDLLSDSLIPVIYDEESDKWLKADIHKKWYDYDEQWWANAVTVSTSTRDSYKAMSPNEPIEMSDIETMWVWIPRYKYKINGTYGTHLDGTAGTQSLPGAIDIVFESGVNTTGVDGTQSTAAKSEYYTHPAFRNGNVAYNQEPYDLGGWDSELTGIWVGKFEMSSDSGKLLIKPDKKSLRSKCVSNIFTSSRELSASGNTYGIVTTSNSHMIKNTEWGAVAYLSQSKYGKYGNTNYIGANKEIYKNDSSEYYTGRSSGTFPASGSTTYGTYSYNDKACSDVICTGSKTAYKGTGASTTGNIYGIYDMSGGADDYVMGNYNDTTKNSGLASTWFSNNMKYYDKYTTLWIGTAYIRGDATYETNGWYNDETFHVDSGNSWFRRSGDYSGNTNTGIFKFSRSDGGSKYEFSSRQVLVK